MIRRPAALPAIVAATLLTLCALGSRGDAQTGPLGTTAEAGTAVYRNDDGLRVLSPWAGVRQQVGVPLSVHAGWKADVVTSASVDVITAATRRFEETRHQAELDGRYRLGDLQLSAGYTGSTERDTTSHYMNLGAQGEFLERNLTLGLNYGLSLDRLGTAYDLPEQRHHRTSHVIDLVATQLLGPSTLVSAGYGVQLMRGFLSSAYRRVPLFPTNTDLWNRQYAQWVAERHPDSRDRHAASLRVKHAFSPRVFGTAWWRGYLDTWSMRSHTAELGLGVDLGHGFLLELADRVYRQSSVSFYRSVYTVNRAYITRDRRLGKMYTNVTRLDGRYVSGRFEALLRGELHWTRYADFRALIGNDLSKMPDTLALVVEAALAVGF